MSFNIKIQSARTRRHIVRLNLFAILAHQHDFTAYSPTLYLSRPLTTRTLSRTLRTQLAHIPRPPSPPLPENDDGLQTHVMHANNTPDMQINVLKTLMIEVRRCGMCSRYERSVTVINAFRFWVNWDFIGLYHDEK